MVKWNKSGFVYNFRGDSTIDSSVHGKFQTFKHERLIVH